MSHKIQITVEDNLYDWFKLQANSYGISFSGLTNMAMSEYKAQKEMMGNIPQMMELFSKAMALNELQGDKK